MIKVHLTLYKDPRGVVNLCDGEPFSQPVGPSSEWARCGACHTISEANGYLSFPEDPLPLYEENNMDENKNTSVGPEEIENRFGFHKATIEGDNATLPKHRDLRVAFKQFAEYLDQELPPGRAKSVAFTELENASMWSHKAIAELAPTISEPRLVQED